ncbi:MAG TPA: DUF6166 domain-containing protein [Candidatus Cybelea sp.]|nr:DUF6166 domain-containing protein [Candidatus Cybelea sp.]
MKSYQGHRAKSGDAQVYVVQSDGTAEALPTRLDLQNHSPDGFEWGYSGSGPAQLALAILADALKASVRKNRSDWFDEAEDDPRTVAVRLHQFFKREFIAGLARDRQWTITEETVKSWIARALKQEKIDVDRDA